MKIVIIGAVAAGTSAAAKARRNDEAAEIIVYEKDSFISYSGCGMPYYLGDKVKEVEELAPRDPVFFKKRYDVDIMLRHEVLRLDTDGRRLLVKNMETGECFWDSYDRLVIATGASPYRPSVPGIKREQVFFLRSMGDMIQIRRFIDGRKPGKIVIAGTGFIGMELLENLTETDMSVSMVEAASQITPSLDLDMSLYLENKLKERNVRIWKSTAIASINESSVELTSGEKLPADMVIMAMGVRPNTGLAAEAGIQLGTSGGIVVNRYMETNVPGIYACGDCIETFSTITGKPVYRPLGSTANKTGRIAGENVTGGVMEYKGNLGTGIFRIFDWTVATTGLTEREAETEGYEVQVCHNIKPDKPTYMGGKEMIIKAVADRISGRLLGAQIIGEAGVDKRIDVFVTLITYHAKVEELFDLDLAYAPPFSTTKDPIHYTGMILDNAINRGRPLITVKQLEEMCKKEPVRVIDARSPSDYQNKKHVEGALNLPHENLREACGTMDKEDTVVIYCNKGVTGNAAQNILIGRGIKKVYNLSGGNQFYQGSREK